ncbi:MAG: hypothetical protein VW836_00865, partial [Alphaproteobacteria bacterium]
LSEDAARARLRRFSSKPATSRAGITNEDNVIGGEVIFIIAQILRLLELFNHDNVWVGVCPGGAGNLKHE